MATNCSRQAAGCQPEPALGSLIHNTASIVQRQGGRVSARGWCKAKESRDHLLAGRLALHLLAAAGAGGAC